MILGRNTDRTCHSYYNTRAEGVFFSTGLILLSVWKLVHHEPGNGHVRGTSCAACGKPTSSLMKDQTKLSVCESAVLLPNRPTPARTQSEQEITGQNGEKRLMRTCSQRKSHVGVLEMTFDLVVEFLSVTVELHDAFRFFSDPEPIELVHQVTCRGKGGL